MTDPVRTVPPMCPECDTAAERRAKARRNPLVGLYNFRTHRSCCTSSSKRDFTIFAGGVQFQNICRTQVLGGSGKINSTSSTGNNHTSTPGLAAPVRGHRTKIVRPAGNFMSSQGRYEDDLQFFCSTCVFTPLDGDATFRPEDVRRASRPRGP